MKYVMLLMLGIASGCANNAASTSAVPATQRYYQPIAAGALAFDPPIASETLRPDLSREGRSAGAFAGYEQTVTSYYYVHQRDQIRIDNNGRFERTAYSDTTAVISR